MSKISDKRIILEPPEDILATRDRNLILGWCIRELRNGIAKSGVLEGQMLPLGDLSVISAKQAAEYIGVKQSTELVRYIKKYEEETGIQIKPLTQSTNNTPYLKDDIHLLKIWVHDYWTRSRGDRTYID